MGETMEIEGRPLAHSSERTLRATLEAPDVPEILREGIRRELDLRVKGREQEFLERLDQRRTGPMPPAGATGA